MENNVFNLKRLYQEAKTRYLYETDSDYKEFFKSALKKFKISSPADLKDEAKKKEFFTYIDKNWTGKSE